jgi:hypothetical protein
MLASTVLVMSLPSSLQATGPWSQPATLAPCSAPGAPAVLFPTDEPHHATGPGAIVWGAGSACAGGAGAHVSAIAPGSDAPGRGSAAHGADDRAISLSPPITAQTAPHGRLLLVGTSGASGSGRLALSEGTAGGPFTAPWATGGPSAPLALTSAYLGDVAVVSPGGANSRAGRTPRIELRVHRYYTRAFQPPVPVASTNGTEDVVVAMDYRSDALVVWERDGTIYARDMPGSGRSSRTLARVAGANPGAHITALLSDDNRAILAWSETRSGVTSIYAELSGTGPRFGRPRLLERFSDPGGRPPPGNAGAPRLIRLSSESVMLAWSGVTAGRWIVRTAAVDENGVRAVAAISAPGREALLDDLVPGPDGEAYALWSEPRAADVGASGGRAAGGNAAGGNAGRSRLEYGDQALYAARGIDAYPGRTIFSASQPVSAAGGDGVEGEEAAVGVDPDSDRAIAAWRTPGGAIDYSLHAIGESHG